MCVVSVAPKSQGHSQDIKREAQQLLTSQVLTAEGSTPSTGLLGGLPLGGLEDEPPAWRWAPEARKPFGQQVFRLVANKIMPFSTRKFH